MVLLLLFRKWFSQKALVTESAPRCFSWGGAQSKVAQEPQEQTHTGKIF